MKNKLKGGKADNLTIKDIAKKFDVSVKDVKSQIKKGKKVESEHTGDEEKQTEIAMDHVSEFPDYYDRIDKMEKEALKYWKKKETNESRVLIKKLLREELESLDEGLGKTLATAALGGALAFGGLGKAKAQDTFKDKIENLGDKMTQLKTGAGEKLSQFKDDLKQTVSNIKDKSDLKNIGSRNYSFDEIKKEFEEKSKNDNMEYGEGKGRMGASINANNKYMDKHNIKTQYDKKVFVTNVNQVEVERHDVKKADGTNVTLILYRFEPM